MLMYREEKEEEKKLPASFCWGTSLSRMLLLLLSVQSHSELLENNAHWRACVANGGNCSVGIHCGINCLSLNLQNISGTIPPGDVAQLTMLRQFDIDANTISGTIPPNFASMTQLEVLGLSHNQISGTIPAALGNLTELLVLFLQSNKISGTIPDSFRNFSRLLTLDAAFNQLTGAASGICAINTDTIDCDFRNNPAWTDGALCPACLNEGGCQTPIRCTGSGGTHLPGV